MIKRQFQVSGFKSISAVCCLLSAVGATPVAAQPNRAFAVEAEFERIARSASLWPGFEPMEIPLAIYDGARTYLFRHPAPPEGFAALSSPRPASVYEGRYQLMVANTSVDLAGTRTATLLLEGSDTADSTSLAATALHEAFHVFQRSRHFGWQANEGNLFLYPSDDVELLRYRLTETLGLRKALAAEDADESACWTRKALESRQARFASMDSIFAAYERESELNEGLATYVQLRAAGDTTVDLPEAGFAAGALRDRFYAVGPALAFLLDRFRPGWRESFEEKDDQYLDATLDTAVRQLGGRDNCGWSGPETEALDNRAHAGVASLIRERKSKRNAFDALPGWRLVIETEASRPLWPQGFDPLNVERVDDGILHTRFLRLSNESGEMEMVEARGASVEALTESAGRHPLFNGVRRVTVAGLGQPEISEDASEVKIQTPGVSARFTDVEVRKEGRTIRIGLR